MNREINAIINKIKMDKLKKNYYLIRVLIIVDW